MVIKYGEYVRNANKGRSTILFYLNARAVAHARRSKVKRTVPALNR